MINFELCKEMEKDVFCWLWDKENILSPHKKSNLRTSDSFLRCSTIEPNRLYGEQSL